MILGVSHIVLASTDLTRDRQTLESIGWKTQFEQRSIPTHPGKRPFMSTQSTEQGLIFMHPGQGTPVELIHYADELPDRSDSPMQIVLPQPQIHAPLGHLTCPLQFAATAPVPSLITHFVTDMDAASRFWQKGLGFKRAAAQDGPPGSLQLEFRSLMPHWRATLLLLPREKTAIPSLLDGPGFRVISMVCSNIDRDRVSAFQNGALHSTGIMDLAVAGKSLRLELLQGVDGAMIELLEGQ
ncbi:MAG: VOC family protein [Prosthecobacter sp.]|uniref:VOC family protein n=1 Tax=Prosthecobacter sp. TaxID=1965333 RepID=UPI0039037B6E